MWGCLSILYCSRGSCALNPTTSPQQAKVVAGQRWARGQQQSPARVPPFLQAGSRFELSAWKLPEMGPGARLGLAIVSSVSGLGSQRPQCS